MNYVTTISRHPLVGKFQVQANREATRYKQHHDISSLNESIGIISTLKDHKLRRETMDLSQTTSTSSVSRGQTDSCGEPCSKDFVSFCTNIFQSKFREKIFRDLQLGIKQSQRDPAPKAGREHLWERSHIGSLTRWYWPENGSGWILKVVENCSMWDVPIGKSTRLMMIDVQARI